MDFVSSLFDSVQANSDYLNFFGIILAALVSVYIFKGEHSISFAKEQHDNLISPLFDLLEPVLFQVMDPTICAELLSSSMLIEISQTVSCWN